MDAEITGCVARDGTLIGCTTFGEGQPAMLLMSWRTTMQQQFESSDAAPFYAEISSRLRITTYDRRGVGASSRAIDDTSIEAQLDDVLIVMDAGNLRVTDLIADNDACYVAVRFAAAHPDRVRRLVLWSPLVGGHDARPVEMRAHAQLMRRDYAAACYEWAKWSTPANDAERRAAADRFASQRSGTVAANYMEWEADEDVSSLLPEVATPTLVVAPRRLATRSMGVSSMLSDARLEVVDAEPATGALDMAEIARRMVQFLLEPRLEPPSTPL